jgi:ElaB/YqjD/DUF883 family membrane-anchored ribosome-binding protein
MPAESPEVIEQQIADTRRALTSKITELNDRTAGTARGAMEMVTETLEAVTGTVGQVRKMANVGAVSEVIQDTVRAIPLASTVRERPWASVGGAAVAGFITGVLTLRPSSSAPAAVAATPGVPSAVSRIVDRLVERFGTEVRTVADKVMGSVGETVTAKLNGLLPDLRSAPPAATTNGSAHRGYVTTGGAI